MNFENIVKIIIFLHQKLIYLYYSIISYNIIKTKLKEKKIILIFLKEVLKPKLLIYYDL